METLGELRITTPVVRVAWPDKFIEHATTPKDLQDKYHVNSATAVAKIKDALAHVAQTVDQSQKFRVVSAADARTA
jgi:1-deoxy-D-xylulose-5-phosphate synthase